MHFDQFSRKSITVCQIDRFSYSPGPPGVILTNDAQWGTQRQFFPKNIENTF